MRRVTGRCPSHSFPAGASMAAAGAALILAVSASMAEAQYTPNIQGGGATLPAPTYRQHFNCYGMPLTNPPDQAADTDVPLPCQDPTAYPIDGTKIFRYAGVGSGRGQCMYLTHNAMYNNDASRPITEVHFVGSDAKLTADQIARFQTGGVLGNEASACNGVSIPAQALVYGPLIMVPSLATAISFAISPDTALALNIQTSMPVDGTSGLTLSRRGYCKMLTGQITDWNSTDPDFISQNIDPITGVPAPFSYTSLPLRLVYRTDGSGTTFLLTQHLAAVQSACGSTMFSSGAGETMPLAFRNLPNVVGASGSGGVENALLGTSNVGRVGYLSPDFTAHASVGSHAAVTANLVNAAGNAVPPSPAATTAGMSGQAPPTGAARKNQSNWVPLVADPSDPAAYPIVGYTTQEFYSCYQLSDGQDVKAAGIRGYLSWALSSLDADHVLNGNGLAPLPGAWKAAILDTFVTGDSNNLQIRVGPVFGFCSSGS